MLEFLPCIYIEGDGEGAGISNQLQWSWVVLPWRLLLLQLLGLGQGLLDVQLRLVGLGYQRMLVMWRGETIAKAMHRLQQRILQRRHGALIGPGMLVGRLRLQLYWMLSGRRLFGGLRLLQSLVGCGGATRAGVRFHGPRLKEMRL